MHHTQLNSVLDLRSSHIMVKKTGINLVVGMEIENPGQRFSAVLLLMWCRSALPWERDL